MQQTAEPDLLARATTYADAVVSAALREGDEWQWPTPSDIDSRLAGSNSYGFAHGVAGIGAFLLAAAEATCPEDTKHPYWQAALGAGETLLRAARRGHQVEWPAEFGSDRVGVGNWCNGPSGIGTFLVRLGAATGNQRFTDLAELAAAAVVHNQWHAGIGACCGLAGDGQFLLDMAEITGQEAYRHHAEAIAGIIDHHRNGLDGIQRTADQNYGCDYQHGIAGVLDFILRLRYGGPRSWMPHYRTSIIHGTHS